MKAKLPAPPTGPRILVADGAPLQAQAVESMVRSSGWTQVRTTSDGREIAPLYLKWPFEVLVLDMGMGGMNAIDVLTALHGPIRQGGLAVVAVTEPGDAHAIERALFHGAVDVCIRPLSRAEIQPRIKNALVVRKVPAGPPSHTENSTPITAAK